VDTRSLRDPRAGCDSSGVTRVAFLGVNSAEFARDDLIGLAGMPELGHLEVALHDPDAGRLRHAAALAHAAAAHAAAAHAAGGARVDVRACASRAEALDGADYVVCELEVGGIAATRADFEIPARYGLRQTAGDTIGVGGIFRGLRTLPAVLDIARDMAAHCPAAYLLNYSNPMAMSTWAAYTALPPSLVYGLCHAVPDTHRRLADLLSADVADLDLLTAGFNHQAFVLRLARDGVSLYPRVAEILDADPAALPPVSAELFRRFGYCTTQQQAEYLPWVMRHARERARLRVPAAAPDRGEEETRQAMAQDRRRLADGEPLVAGEPAALAPLFIHAVSTGADRRLYVNVRNGGLIAGLPEDCCVEVPCDIVAGAPVPRPVGPLPPQVTALNRTFLNVVELTVRAVLDGDRRHVYHAALLDPNAAATLTTAQIIAVCDDLFAAHDGLLPPRLSR
jgi:alpha-galactosidase